MCTSDAVMVIPWDTSIVFKNAVIMERGCSLYMASKPSEMPPKTCHFKDEWLKLCIVFFVSCLSVQFCSFPRTGCNSNRRECPTTRFILQQLHFQTMFNGDCFHISRYNGKPDKLLEPSGFNQKLRKALEVSRCNQIIAESNYLVQLTAWF